MSSRTTLDIALGELSRPGGVYPVEIAEASIPMFGDDGRRVPRVVFLQLSSEGLFVCFSLDPVECFFSGRDLLRVSERWEALSMQRIPVADLMRRSLG